MKRPEQTVESIDGAAAPPRRNGELVFEAPWQGRVFGIALALSKRGSYSWDTFREHLMREIAGGEIGTEPSAAAAYYRHWLRALEAVLVGRGVLRADDIERRARDALAGHDD